MSAAHTHALGVLSWETTGSRSSKKQSSSASATLTNAPRVHSALTIYIYSAVSHGTARDTPVSVTLSSGLSPYGNMPAEYECHYIDALLLLSGAFLCAFLAHKQPFLDAFPIFRRVGGVCVYANEACF
jgi:hypothetical protein